jgi:HlyD family secretion protein
MKKIINKIGTSLIASSLLLSSCGNNDKEENQAPIPTTPTQVTGIGKILPEGGLVLLSVDAASKVTKIHHKIGDTVHVGDILFEMDGISENLNLQQEEAGLLASKANAIVSDYDIANAKIKLKELELVYQTSKKLYAKGAETKEKALLDSLSWIQQKTLVEQNQKKYDAQLANVNQQNKRVASVEVKANNKQYKAAQNGVLTRFNVRVGEILNVNNTFGELAPFKPLVIEGEVDEFYATQIKTGQKAYITLVGRTDTIATGTISFVGASLQNKSILYETVGEANDRRVRRFTITLNEPSTSLLINQKVECKIEL